MTDGAVFLDRDNTIVRDPGYLHDPSAVELMPEAAAGLAALSEQGWPLIVVSNQSGMARGQYGPEAWNAVNARIAELLGPATPIAAFYYCPHHPDFTGPCDCRKPGVKLFREAARAHGISLEASWYLGDRWSDVQPAQVLGGRGLLVHPEPSPEVSLSAAAGDIRTVRTLREAAAVVGTRK